MTWFPVTLREMRVVCICLRCLHLILESCVFKNRQSIVYVRNPVKRAAVVVLHAREATINNLNILAHYRSSFMLVKLR